MLKLELRLCMNVLNLAVSHPSVNSVTTARSIILSSIILSPTRVNKREEKRVS